MLKVDNIHKTYKGGIRAVDGVSLALQSGEILGIVGPNGAGKTTTIRMILNIIKPDSGTITINGQPASEAAKNSIGYLPEERGLYKKNGIADSLRYFGSLKGMSGAPLEAAIEKWLKRFNLEGSGKRKTEELSKGNQQKVQFIAAVLHDPSILILDEPFSGLDPVNQLLFTEVVMELRAAGKAIVFCTHQLEAAEKFCNSITMLSKGKVVLQGPIDAVKKQYGKNTASVEFSGDIEAEALRPHLDDLVVFSNSIEGKLRPGSALNDVLGEVMKKARVHKAAVIEPTLLQIFVDMVGANNVSEDFLKQVKDGEA